MKGQATDNNRNRIRGRQTGAILVRRRSRRQTN